MSGFKKRPSEAALASVPPSVRQRIESQLSKKGLGRVSPGSSGSSSRADPTGGTVIVVDPLANKTAIVQATPHNIKVIEQGRQITIQKRAKQSLTSKQDFQKRILDKQGFQTSIGTSGELIATKGDRRTIITQKGAFASVPMNARVSVKQLDLNKKEQQRKSDQRKILAKQGFIVSKVNNSLVATKSKIPGSAVQKVDQEKKPSKTLLQRIDQIRRAPVEGYTKLIQGDREVRSTLKGYAKARGGWDKLSQREKGAAVGSAYLGAVGRIGRGVTSVVLTPDDMARSLFTLITNPTKALPAIYDEFKRDPVGLFIEFWAAKNVFKVGGKTIAKTTAGKSFAAAANKAGNNLKKVALKVPGTKSLVSAATKLKAAAKSAVVKNRAVNKLVQLTNKAKQRIQVTKGQIKKGVSKLKLKPDTAKQTIAKQKLRQIEGGRRAIKFQEKTVRFLRKTKSPKAQVDLAKSRIRDFKKRLRVLDKEVNKLVNQGTKARLQIGLKLKSKAKAKVTPKPKPKKKVGLQRKDIKEAIAREKLIKIEGNKRVIKIQRNTINALKKAKASKGQIRKAVIILKKMIKRTKQLEGEVLKLVSPFNAAKILRALRQKSKVKPKPKLKLKKKITIKKFTKGEGRRIRKAKGRVIKQRGSDELGKTPEGRRTLLTLIRKKKIKFEKLSTRTKKALRKAFRKEFKEKPERIMILRKTVLRRAKIATPKEKGVGIARQSIKEAVARQKLIKLRRIQVKIRLDNQRFNALVKSNQAQVFRDALYRKIISRVKEGQRIVSEVKKLINADTIKKLSNEIRKDKRGSVILKFKNIKPKKSPASKKKIESDIMKAQRIAQEIKKDLNKDNSISQLIKDFEKAKQTQKIIKQDIVKVKKSPFSPKERIREIKRLNNVDNVLKQVEKSIQGKGQKTIQVLKNKQIAKIKQAVKQGKKGVGSKVKAIQKTLVKNVGIAKKLNLIKAIGIFNRQILGLAAILREEQRQTQKRQLGQKQELAIKTKTKTKQKQKVEAKQDQKQDTVTQEVTIPKEDVAQDSATRQNQIVTQLIGLAVTTKFVRINGKNYQVKTPPTKKGFFTLKRRVLSLIKRKRFIFIPDLFSIIFGIRAKPGQKVKLLRKGRIFTGTELRPIVIGRSKRR